MPNDTLPSPDRPTTINVSALGPLVSILIPCCGMREYTSLLVPSLLKQTRPPFELIFLDVGSLDGTAEYLEGLAAGLPNLRIEIVRAATDLDLGEATKEALAKVRGDYVVLLNNDAVVTNGWLNQLLGLVNMSPAIGMVGPMSNYAAPPQLVESIPYRIAPKKAGAAAAGKLELLDVAAVERFASEFRETNKGKWVEAERLGGFCLLLKREVLRRVTNQGQHEDRLRQYAHGNMP
jgi:GT2 family glycosyltransferase